MAEPSLMPLPAPSSSNSSKKRIRVACDTCRRKKIKCNGGYPCSNCLQANEPDCHYKERPKKDPNTTKKPKRASTIKTLEQLDSRMQKLESSISLIASQLLSIVPSSSASGIHPITRKPEMASDQEFDSEDDDDANENDDNDDDDDDDEEEEDDDDDDFFDDNNNSSTSSPTYHDNYPNKKPKKNSTANSTNDANDKNDSRDSKKEPAAKRKVPKNLLHNRKFETHFGNHSFLGIFSQKSLRWILQSLGTEHYDIIAPFFKFPFAIQRKMKNSIGRWVEVPTLSEADRTRLETPFPETPELAFALLDTYYERIVQCRVLLPTPRIRDLFERYYGFKGDRKRVVKPSELLIMTVALAFCLCCKVESDNRPVDSLGKLEIPEVIKSLDAKTALDLQNTYLDNAIYYYHKISIISEGIETIEAILFLVMYVEISWFSSHVNFVLTSVAIRYAQELGFHRAEAYEGLSEEESTRRRKIWWYCYYFDLEICFRSGKPPVINASDVSNHFGPEVHLSPFSVISPDSMVPTSLLNDHLTFPEVKSSFDYLHADDGLVYHHYYFTLLTRLRSRSYKTLFMANAKIDNFTALSTALDDINSEMFELRHYIPEDAKPYFHNHPSFKPLELKTIKDDSKLAVQLSYFSHLMTVNRIPLLVRTSDYDESSQRGVNYKNLSLDSARTILLLVKSFSHRSSLAFFNWIVFFPLSAFLNLLASIINHPTAPEVYDDINLLIDSSMNFFTLAIHLDNSKRSFIQQNEDTLISAIIKLMLRVVITMVEVKTNTTIKTEAIEKHIMSAYEEFPDLLRNITLKANITGSSPFSTETHKRHHNLAESEGSKEVSQEPGVNVNNQANGGAIDINSTGSMSSDNNFSPNVNSLLRMVLPNNLNGTDLDQNQFNLLQNQSLVFDGTTDASFNVSPSENTTDFQLYDQVFGLPNFFFDNSLGSNHPQNM